MKTSSHPARRVLVLVLVLVVLLVVYFMIPDPPTAVPPTPATATPLPTEALPLAPTAVPTETPFPTETPSPAPTAVPDQPTATPIPPSPTATATEVATEPPPTEIPATETPMFVGDELAPGEQDTATLAAGEFKIYFFNGTTRQPALIFVEAVSTLDIAVAIYDEVVTAATLSDGRSPLSQADFSRAGGSEILAFTPREDGNYALVVSNMAATAGEFTLYLFDAQSSIPDVAQSGADTLAAGETKTYTVQSNGRRPVIVLAHPIGLTDLVIQITGGDGAVVGEANYGDGGSVEALFVYPLQTTEYTIHISEANGAAATYEVVIVTLD